MPGRTLAQGLMAATGEQLRLIYVLVMETGIFHMISNKTKDFLDKGVDHAEERLKREMAKLEHISDDALRLKLFLHMTKMFELPGTYYNTSQEIENRCGEILQKAHAEQLKKEKDYRAFVSRNSHLPIDSLLALYQMQKLFQSLGSEISSLTEEQQENFTDQIENFISSLPEEQQKKIKEKLNIDDLTNSTIKKVMVTQGSAVLLAVIVEIAGFAAYTGLASLIAGIGGLLNITFPFAVYTTATSALSIMTGPIGFLVIGGVGGAMILTQGKKVKKSLLQMGIIQLMLPILLDDANVYHYEPLIREWTTNYDEQTKLLTSISVYKEKQEELTKKLKATENDIRMTQDKLMDVIHSYHKILDQLANSLTLVEEHEMTEAFKEKKQKIEGLENEKLSKELSIRKNKYAHSWKKKIGGLFSNLSLERDIRKIDKQIEELKMEQAMEVLDILPIHLEEPCNAAKFLMEEKQKLQEKRTRLKEQEEKTKIKLADVKQNLWRKEDALRTLQKEIYGLGDIV